MDLRCRFTFTLNPPARLLDDCCGNLRKDLNKLGEHVAQVIQRAPRHAARGEQSLQDLDADDDDDDDDDDGHGDDDVDDDDDDDDDDDGDGDNDDGDNDADDSDDDADDAGYRNESRREGMKERI